MERVDRSLQRRKVARRRQFRGQDQTQTERQPETASRNSTAIVRLSTTSGLIALTLGDGISVLYRACIVFVMLVSRLKPSSAANLVTDLSHKGDDMIVSP